MARLWDLASKSVLKEYAGAGDLYAISASRDGKRILSIGSEGKGYLWDLKSGEKLHEYQLPTKGNRCGFSRDGQFAFVRIEGGTGIFLLGLPE